jgi:glycolate oxidase
MHAHKLDGRILAEKLHKIFRGRIVTDHEILRRYSTDQSIYRIMPLMVAMPVDPQDLAVLVTFAGREGIPVTARGGGSGTAGSALGSGIVVVLPDEGPWGCIGDFADLGTSASVRVGAGVYHNQLQTYLRQHGFFLPADVTSARISRIGGNIGTKASGPHALRYGSIDRFVKQVTFITDRGEIVDTGDENSIPARVSFRLAELKSRLLSDARSVDLLRARRQLKTASGYNLFAFLEDSSCGMLIAKLLAGSVGTLGMITDAVLRAEIFHTQSSVVLLYFDNLRDAARAIGALGDPAPAAMELISRATVAILRQHSEIPERFSQDAHMLLVEFSGPSAPADAEKVATFARRGNFRLSSPPAVLKEAGDIDCLWTIRKRILWLISNPHPGFRALSVVNDVGVPVCHLAGFVDDAQRIFDRHGLTAFIYGHAGNGNLHLRPIFDLNAPRLKERIRRLADDIYGAVLRHGGTITGEHGMGRLRAPYLPLEWGPDIFSYMREIKEIFDPADIFNPGVMISDRPITDNMNEDIGLTGEVE